MTHMGDIEKLVETSELNRDAGAEARKRLESKRKSRKVLWTVLTVLTLFLIAAVSAAGYRVYLEYKKPGVRVTDYRTCKYVSEEQNLELTGKREYSYMQKEFFGIQYRESKKVTESTVVDVRGTAMNIVGLSEGKWKSVYVGEGERGIQILMPAELYIITMGKKTAVFNYADFCK